MNQESIATENGVLPKHENPYFPKQKKEIGKKFVYISGGVIAFLLLAFILFSLLFYRNKSNYVHIAVFTGNNRLSDVTLVDNINEYLTGNYLLLIPKKNIYALRTHSLENFLIDRFGLTSVRVDKIYPQRIIHVQLTERPIQYTVTIDDTTYFLASDGTILEDISQDVQTFVNLFNIIVPTSEVVSGDDSDAHRHITKTILDAVAEIEQQNLQIDTARIIGIKTSEASSNDIQVLTDASWYIYIDRTQDIGLQIQNARTVYNEKIKGTDNEQTLQYIDVRIPGKAYFK